MVLKIIGSLFVIVSCVLYSQFKKHENTAYLKNLEMLYQILFMLKGEIVYTRAPLDETLFRIKNRCLDPYCAWLDYIINEITNKDAAEFSYIWKKGITESLSMIRLKKRHKIVLVEFGQSLVQYDYDTIIGTMQLYLERFQKEIEAENEQLQRKNRLYDYLGIIVGIFCVILLV